jgi:hypothetical protein
MERAGAGDGAGAGGRQVGLARWQPNWFGEPAPAPTEVASRNGMLVAQGRLASR